LNVILLTCFTFSIISSQLFCAIIYVILGSCSQQVVSELVLWDVRQAQSNKRWRKRSWSQKGHYNLLEIQKVLWCAWRLSHYVVVIDRISLEGEEDMEVNKEKLVIPWKGMNTKHCSVFWVVDLTHFSLLELLLFWLFLPFLPSIHYHFYLISSWMHQYKLPSIKWLIVANFPFFNELIGIIYGWFTNDDLWSMWPRFIPTTIVYFLLPSSSISYLHLSKCESAMWNLQIEGLRWLCVH